MGLRVLDHDEDVDGARVLFSVRAFEKGRDVSFHELSRFRQDNGAWRYLDGDTFDGPGRDDLTIASSAAR
jgi:SEC-C motif-containing protein